MFCPPYSNQYTLIHCSLVVRLGICVSRARCVVALCYCDIYTHREREDGRERERLFFVLLMLIDSNSVSNSSKNNNNSSRVAIDIILWCTPNRTQFLCIRVISQFFFSSFFYSTYIFSLDCMFFLSSERFLLLLLLLPLSFSQTFKPYRSLALTKYKRVYICVCGCNKKYISINNKSHFNPIQVPNCTTKFKKLVALSFPLYSSFSLSVWFISVFVATHIFFSSLFFFVYGFFLSLSNV